jgi:dihydrofolate reductase
MTVSIIAAIGKNRELGKNNKLLWNIPLDLSHFRTITKGHAVIMGRKTHESIGRALPKRINIIITRDNNYKSEGCIVCASINDALEIAKKSGEKEAFVIGGGEIYKQAISLADKLYLTIVDSSFDADIFFPDYSEFKKVISKENHKDVNYSYLFLEMEK